ncbi:MAG: aminobutyraldehyde dehydrogenase [Actinobacteria bacterium]|nr:aminobutyraldehyde dehydrogenase [Actinomycetota bacterium]
MRTCEEYSIQKEFDVSTDQRTEAPAAYEQFIGGRWVQAADGGTTEVVNPATGDVIARVPRSGEADVDLAVRAADEARIEWRRHTPGERSTLLLQLADRLEENLVELARLESLNTGKPLSKADGEITYCVDNLRFFAGAARQLEGRSAGEYLRGFTSLLRREPVGVVGQIVPWNYPLMMAAWKVAPALAAGNTVVLKPAEQTPLTLLKFVSLCEGILPAGVLNVITGDGENVGAALARHPRVRMIAVTGGIETGRAVAHLAADTVKRVHLELGGNAPVVVLDDADVEAAAKGIVAAAYENSGQCCIAGPRVLATDAVYGRLLEALPARVEAVRVGDPFADAELDMGPVISRTQQERVMGFLERAEGTSADVLVGGDTLDRPGFFVAPTLIAGVKQGDEIVQREVFGPVLTVQRCADDAEAISMANDSEYGLGASVWTGSVAKAHRAMRDLEYGMVWVNTHLPNTSEMPHGGFKQSGYGKDLSIYSLDDYTQLKLGIINLEE